jgi:hypothetical protein
MEGEGRDGGRIPTAHNPHLTTHSPPPPPLSPIHAIRPRPPRAQTHRAATYSTLGTHDVGPLAEGVALQGGGFKRREAVVEGLAKANMLHRVLYPQVHENGVKKKKKKKKTLQSHD